MNHIYSINVGDKKMKKNIVKKGLAYGMIVLFFGACVVVGATNNIVETDSYNDETHAPFATVAMNSEPILKVNIPAWLGLFQIHLKVQNIGNATAHNVTLSSTSFEGNVLYNNRTFIITETLEPGNTTVSFLWQSGLNLGFGIFIVTITITCDEDASDTTSANGIAFGPFCYIP